VRWITDFRALNMSIKRKVYNLPMIQDILLRRPGYASSASWTYRCSIIPLDWTKPARVHARSVSPSGPIATVDCPWVSISLLMWRKRHEDLFRLVAEVEIYLDDIGVFNTSWEEQFVSLTTVLTVLKTP
jgi:hypothetical protein